MTEKKEISRRSYLKYVGGAAVGAIAGGLVGYGLSESMKPPVTGPTTLTVTAPGTTVTVSALTTASPTATAYQYADFNIARGVQQFTTPVTKPLAEPIDWVSPPSEYKNKKEIVIGSSMPLTGAYSWATPWAKMYENWVKLLNDKGGLLGLPVRLLMYDSGSDVTREIANNTKLATVDKVDLLLGGTPTATILPTFGAIDKYGYLIMNIGCATVKGMTNPPFENIFTYDFGAEVYAYTFWAWLGSLPANLKPKKSAIMYAEYSPFCVDNGKAGVELSRSVGIEPVYVSSYPAGVTDFTSEVIKMRDSGAEVLLSADTEAAPAKLIPKAGQTIGWTPKAYWDIQYIYPGFEDPNKAGSLAPITHHTVLPVNHWPTWPDPPFKDAKLWVDFYTKLIGLSPTTANFDFGWPAGGVQVLQAAVEATGSLDQQVLKNYVWSHSFNTLCGKIEFNEYKMAVGWLRALGQITAEGKEEVIWPAELATGDAVYPRPPWTGA